LKLVDSPQLNVRDRGYFLGLAPGVMRHLAVDRARMRKAAKRGLGGTRVEVGEDALPNARQVIGDGDIDV